VSANLYALGAVALWASLSTLGVLLKHVPPFLLTGLALIIGSLLAWPVALRDRQQWRVTSPVLALGVFTLFGFHFFLFIALRLASAVEVNLVNYLWPLLIVVLAPLYLPQTSWRGVHVVAACVGFAGAALAIWSASTGSAPATETVSAAAANAQPLPFQSFWGYALALSSALIWANYSLQTKRLAMNGQSFPTAAIGLFGLISGALSLACHAVLEPSVNLSARDWALILLMGLGPLGAAFFLWDKALKLGDARHIGLLSYLTPLASTVLLMVVTGRSLTWSIALAAALIIGAAVAGTRRP
jgi:drug/metabolite transporter (DMT)-like permease